jgi:NAD(P)-dependent dehydrogenase (short-subunit alcohol dehydrogenase family)
MAQLQQPKKNLSPAQKQNRQPGLEKKMHPKPVATPITTLSESKLLNKVALITGGDSGIGRAVALAFAEQGADIVISYFDEHDDAQETAASIQKMGRSSLLISGDISSESHCKSIIKKAINKFGSLDILVNNAAEQFPQKSIENITAKQLERTFAVNIFSYFYLTKAALLHLKKGSCIINTTSVTAYRGSPHLLDYSSTKGAIVSFTRSLSHSLVEREIRVNAVAPGPIWTPLIPATFSAKRVKTFGSDVPMGRAGEPNEVASCYVFLASKDSSYMTGQVLHPNGGEIVNG